jgi:hypothetical protein
MLPPLLHAHKHIAEESTAAAAHPEGRSRPAPLRIRAGCDEGGSRTRPYLDQHHSPFAIRRLSPVAIPHERWVSTNASSNRGRDPHPALRAALSQRERAHRTPSLWERGRG